MRWVLVTSLVLALCGCGEPPGGGDDSTSDPWLPDTGDDGTGDAVEDPLFEPPECREDGDCDDADPCTRDGCVEGACVHEPFTGQAFTEPDVQVTEHPWWVSDVQTSWTGATLGIAWTDGRDGGCREIGLLDCNTEVYFNRLSSEAEVLGADVKLSDSETETFLWNLRWSGSEHLALWMDGGRDVTTSPWVTRVAPAGLEVGDEFGPGTVEPYVYSPRVAWTGSEIAVTWIHYIWGGSDPLELHMTRFTPDGTEVADVVLVTDEDLRTSRHYVAWTGSELAMTYAISSDSYMGRFTPDGTMVDEVDLRFYMTRDWVSAFAWTGSEFGLFYRGAAGPDDPCLATYCNQQSFRRLAPDGTDVGEPVCITDDVPDQYITEVVWTGSEWGLTWNRLAVWGYEAWLTRLGPDGVRVEDDLQLRQPSAVAWTGTAYVLAWSELRDGDWNVFANVVGRCE